MRRTRQIEGLPPEVAEFVSPMFVVATITTITSLAIAVIAFLYSLKVDRTLLIYGVIIPMMIVAFTSCLSGILAMFYTFYYRRRILRMASAILFLLCIFAMLAGIIGMAIVLYAYYAG